jgi:hemerythrin-like domain-containing protein
MLPIGPLMIEHRLIERMIAVIVEREERAAAEEEIDPRFVEVAVDFIRTYADRTHHGKEEDILFRDLEGRDLDADDALVMGELIEEHRRGRALTAELVSANERYAAGDKAQLSTISAKLRELAEFYPKHIEKEDKVFFPASMEYLNDAEKRDMLERMWEFDRRMIHEKYKSVVESYESCGDAS